MHPSRCSTTDESFSIADYYTCACVSHQVILSYFASQLMPSIIALRNIRQISIPRQWQNASQISESKLLRRGFLYHVCHIHYIRLLRLEERYFCLDDGLYHFNTYPGVLNVPESIVNQTLRSLLMQRWPPLDFVAFLQPSSEPH